MNIYAIAVRASILLSLVLLSIVVGAGQTVSGRFAASTVTRGKPVKATVTLDIPAELHTNSNRPSEPNLIPTTVKVNATGLVISTVRYPPGHDRKFEFASKPLNVYQGKVDFTFDVTVPRSFRGKEVSVEVGVRYQACTEEVCYPPKTKTVTLMAPVR